VPLRPSQVHPEEHLGPVGRFGAPGSGADRQDRRAIVVLAREDQRRPLAPECGVEIGVPGLELSGELGIVGFLDQRDQLDEVVGALLEPAPQVDLGTKAVGLAEDLLGGALVVPEAGRLGLGVELREARAAGV
jgi:hypothetical protein